jgi:tRNA (guanine10-N2)-dimethyltransferase
MAGAHKQLRRVDLERDVGSMVKETASQLKVDLTNPDVTFVCLLNADSFILGLSRFAKPSGLIAPRLPRRRPIFHPSTMPPKIARCMVNLARPQPNATFVDPFSGVGGIALEAAMIGCNVIALDANLRMVRGVRKNLRHFGLNPFGLIKSDARHIPLLGVDAIATDPPYGRGSSTMGVKMTHLIEEFLSVVGDVLKAGSHVCISAPDQVRIEDYAQQAGLTVREKHLARVHRSLTRQFVVLKNS